MSFCCEPSARVFSVHWPRSDFIFAENQREARTELAASPERFAEFQFGGRQLDAEAGVAQVLAAWMAVA